VSRAIFLQHHEPQWPQEKTQWKQLSQVATASSISPTTTACVALLPQTAALQNSRYNEPAAYKKKQVMKLHETLPIKAEFGTLITDLS
jgi:hypothetical protein